MGNILLETGDALLLESGDFLLLDFFDIDVITNITEITMII